ncbi:hypothetical protein RRG08_049205 [Elysia crispata]|nr:hypothetical protein RRG08_049205 [Elysia crispata]
MSRGSKNLPAKIELLSFQSSFNDNEDFLVAGEDTTVIQFEVSGNNSVHSFGGENGPQFYCTTTDMASHMANLSIHYVPIRSFGVTECIKIFIGVGLVALLATVAGVGVMCYKKYGDAEAINNNA